MSEFSESELQQMREQAQQLGRGAELENTLLALISEIDARQAEERFERQRQAEAER